MASVEHTEELSIFKYRDEIVSKVKNNIVTLIFGGKTGCGKSTQVPQFLMDDFNKESCNIIVTEPRRIAAMTIAKRVSYERKCELGKEVGYQTGLTKKRSTNETKLTYCTTGVLLEKIIYSKNIDQYSHIILDEIHERDVETDLLMNIIRQLLLIDCDTKLILMSATLNVEMFLRYFTLRFGKAKFMRPAEVSIEADNHYSIDVKYLDDLKIFRFSEKVINYSAPSITTELYGISAMLIKSRLTKDSKSVLVFLPGIFEIESLRSILLADKDIKDKCVLIILHSSLPTERQKEAFIRSTLPKVILSTNLAESSVTIPDVDCVIDFCLTKNMVCENLSFSTLKLEFASKNSCVQRAGRTGRICDGEVYRLIHKRSYNHLLEENIPEMQRAPLENVFLRVKILEIEKPIPFLSKCISPPAENFIRRSVVKLKELGGLKLLEENGTFINDDGCLTFIGKIMANLPIDVRLSKLVVLGYIYSILDEIVIIAAGLSIRNVFKTNYDQKLHNYLTKTRWSNGSACDAIALYNAYSFWREEKEKGTLKRYDDEQKFCNTYELDRKNLNEMHLLVMKLQERLKDLNLQSIKGANIVHWEPQDKLLIIKLCLAGAFMPNMFLKGKSDEDTEREVYKGVLGMDHNRTVFFRRMDRDQIGIVYAERIKERLVQHGIADTTEGIKIHFDSTKVYVTFDEQVTMIDDEDNNFEQQQRNNFLFPGAVCNEVYRAVKFRKINKTCTFMIETLKAAETKEYARKLGILEEIRGKEEVKKKICIWPESNFLPMYNQKEVEGTILYVEHCNKFFFHPMDEGFLEEVESSMKDEDCLTVVTNPEIGKLIVAIHEQNFKRAKIVKLYKTHAYCFFFDYGYTKEIKLDDIYELSEPATEYYFSINECSFQCRLMGIAPSYEKCPRGKWIKEVIDDFRWKFSNIPCKIVVYSMVQDVCAVELFVNGKSVNEYLVSKGYARKVGEPYCSRLNHNERENVQSSVSPWFSRAEEFKDKESNILKISVEPPPLNDCNTIIRLDGPHSPLETQIYEITLNNLGTISIDPTSVNSVVLDEEVQNYDGFLMVAAEVHKNQSRDYTLYNVTSMPNIFSLPVLIAMIFSPNMMFFANNEMEFEGIRFGLGYDPHTFEAYNYEQDCYLPINYRKEFLGDIQDINQLRFNMSTLITADSESVEMSDDQKLKLMNDTKRLILKIMTKKRIRVEPTSFSPNRGSNWRTKFSPATHFSNDTFKSGPFCSIQLPTNRKTKDQHI